MTDAARAFRRRPDEVQAIQWVGEANCEAVFAFLGWHHSDTETDHSVIYLEGLDTQWTAEPGDWIVRDADGEFYPVKASIFAATYEEV
jgi:hypothetical protein